MYPDLAAEPRVQVGQVFGAPSTSRPFPECTLGQEPLQPCPLLAGFLGAWCGCSILTVKAETFLKKDDLKTELMENWLSRLLRAVQA